MYRMVTPFPLWILLFINPYFRHFINKFSRQTTGFQRWVKLFERNFFVGKSFPLEPTFQEVKFAQCLNPNETPAIPATEFFSKNKWQSVWPNSSNTIEKCNSININQLLRNAMPSCGTSQLAYKQEVPPLPHPSCTHYVHTL